MSVNKGFLGFGDISLSWESCSGSQSVRVMHGTCGHSTNAKLCVCDGVFVQCPRCEGQPRPTSPHLTPPLPSQAWLDLLM